MPSEPTPEQVALAQETVRNLPELMAELRRRDQYKIKRYFQDGGPYRRELYPKFVDFFKAGAIHRERALIAANRVGKSDGGSYEVTVHLTGEYPDWWEGYRFQDPIRAWASGTTGEKTKDIIQAKLLGPDNARGTGMIPARYLHHVQPKGGSVPGAVGSIWVHHVSGGLSVLQLKSYDQGRPAFEGTEQHLVWLDEEPPMDIYTECLLRTMATGGTAGAENLGGFAGGILFMTFTPLNGMTEVVGRFMPQGTIPANGIVPDEEMREVAS